MAKVKTSNIKSKKAKVNHFRISLTSKNYYIIGFGIVLIIIGYILMGMSPVDGFIPTVISPVLLVAGYCVMIPFGILFKDKSVITEDEDAKNLNPVKTDNINKSATANIKTT
jgi:hypothetical protein